MGFASSIFNIFFSTYSTKQIGICPLRTTFFTILIGMTYVQKEIARFPRTVYRDPNQQKIKREKDSDHCSNSSVFSKHVYDK